MFKFSYVLLIIIISSMIQREAFSRNIGKKMFSKFNELNDYMNDKMNSKFGSFQDRFDRDDRWSREDKDSYESELENERYTNESKRFLIIFC